jgi:hypothetical protein
LPPPAQHPQPQPPTNFRCFFFLIQFNIRFRSSFLLAVFVLSSLPPPPPQPPSLLILGIPASSHMHYLREVMLLSTPQPPTPTHNPPTPTHNPPTSNLQPPTSNTRHTDPCISIFCDPVTLTCGHRQDALAPASSTTAPHTLAQLLLQVPANVAPPPTYHDAQARQLLLHRLAAATW